MATIEPSKSETSLLENDNMEVDPLSDSVTQINLSDILNKTIQPDGQKETPVDEGSIQIANFIKTRSKLLKAALTILAKASHHKAFMETCLNVGSQYDATPYVALHCLGVDTRRNAMQCNARIDSDPILVFLCVSSLRLIAKKY